ncbi:MAG: type I secretion system permease/ATPase [Rhodocyclales bacterium]|nr:type I secretion system permease/ATPase [Rhodocyclales bacterium]
MSGPEHAPDTAATASSQANGQPEQPRAIDDGRIAATDGLPTGAEPDPLVACLLLIVRCHGGALTPDGLVAGLPLRDGRLTPALFGRAARRAGMGSKLVRKPLDQLNDALFPAVLLLKNECACVLLGWSDDGRALRVVFPELSDSPVNLSLEELTERYSGYAIYVRPKIHFDARAPEVHAARGGHWFWSVIGENRPLYKDVLLAAFLANLFALGLPLFVRNVYDRVIPNQALDTLWVLTIGVSLMLVGDVVLRTMRGYFIDLAGSRADVKLSASIMERVLGTRMEQRPASAGSLAANLRGFESVRDFIGSATVVTFVDMPFSVLFFIVIGWIAWPMVIPPLIGALVILLYAVSVQRRMIELAEATYRAGSQRNATLIEGLVGFETIKALGAESAIQRKWEQSAALLARLGARLRLLSTTASNGSTFVQQTVTMAIVVVGVYLLDQRAITTGGLIACMMLASRAMSPVAQIAGLLVQYQTASTALTGLDETMKREVERPEDATFISRGRLRGAIEFRDVSFSYPGAQVASLRNVNLKIEPGEHVAILGRIGSGKSTLQKLVLGLYQPAEGAVLIDGIDERQLDPAELRRQIGYVPQDVTLFYGTLHDNITLGTPLAEDAAVVKAIEIAGMHGFVNAHPKGFDMLVGERGDSLSGGQRQSVAIARAVVNDPPILLFDEPTASMDNSSEEGIKRGIKRFAKGRTMLMVSHRTSLLDLVDRIIVMDAGVVVADGPREQVITALRQGRIGRA